MALLRLTCLLISEKSATYTIKWSYTIIWQVRVSLCFDEKLHISKYKCFAISCLAITEEITSVKLCLASFIHCVLEDDIPRDFHFLLQSVPDGASIKGL